GARAAKSTVLFCSFAFAHSSLCRAYFVSKSSLMSAVLGRDPKRKNLWTGHERRGRQGPMLGEDSAAEDDEESHRTKRAAWHGAPASLPDERRWGRGGELCYVLAR